MFKVGDLVRVKKNMAKLNNGSWDLIPNKIYKISEVSQYYMYLGDKNKAYTNDRFELCKRTYLTYEAKNEPEI